MHQADRKAFRRAFRTSWKGEKGGRHLLISWPNIAILQVVKQRKNGKLSIDRRVVQGCKKMIARLIVKTQGGGVINTAYMSVSMLLFASVWHGLLNRQTQ